MNSNIPILNTSAELTKCDVSTLLREVHDPSNPVAFAAVTVLVALAIITCPFTILLNVLVIAAVKTKQKLKTSSNIALGCLAVTDASTGLIAQPMYITSRLLNLLGGTSDEYCRLFQWTKTMSRLFISSSVLHLFLVSFERYFAIKHPFKYTAMQGKTRDRVLLSSSAVAWVLPLATNVFAPLVMPGIEEYIPTLNSFLAVFVALIIFSQVLVYRESHRHEKIIADHQASLEARKNFLKEKKAFKVTICVIGFLFLNYLPILAIRILLFTYTITNVNLGVIMLNTVALVAILNSLINPIIYCIRLRQFRVAFIAMLLRKSDSQAEKFERRMFVSLNTVTRHGTGPQLENKRDVAEQEGGKQLEI